MAPKKRTAAKSKNPLSRGRPKKDKGEVDMSATSDSESTSENPSSSHGDSQPPSPKGPPAAPQAKDPVEESEEWKALKDVNLIDDLRGGGLALHYITDTREHRDFELRARKKLLEMHQEAETLKNYFSTSLRAMRNLCPELMECKLNDFMGSMDTPPTSFEQLFNYSLTRPAPPPTVPHIKIHDPIFEVSDEEEEEADVAVRAPLSSLAKTRVFPSPAKMAKFCTPKNQKSVYQFGTASKLISTSKSARLAKPGEVVYSESGSPILLRKILDTQNHPSERVEVLQPDGTKLEVDIVYRGGKATESSKIRGFKEFAQEVRSIVASRATTARQNRIAPPRITKAQSASKPKPEWR